MILSGIGPNEKRILAQGVDHMRRPVVGIIGNSHRIENRFPVQAVGERNLRAVAEVSGAIPVMFASIPEITDINALLDVVDGVVLTGARANVHPTRFNVDPCRVRSSDRDPGVGANSDGTERRQVYTGEAWGG